MTTEIQAPEGAPDLRQALEQIVATLGPKVPDCIKCLGCAVEWSDALRTAQDALAAHPATVKQDLTVAAPAEAHGDEREQFDGWWKAPRHTIEESIAWNAWQARAALASKVQPKGTVEPAAWKWHNKVTGAQGCYFEDPAKLMSLEHPDYEWTKLYTHPAQAPAPVAGPLTTDECDRLLKSVRYMQGIAERGEGRPMRDDETVEDFVLGYVKRLEAAQAAQAPAVQHGTSQACPDCGGTGVDGDVDDSGKTIDVPCHCTKGEASPALTDEQRLDWLCEAAEFTCGQWQVVIESDAESFIDAVDEMAERAHGISRPPVQGSQP